MSKDPNKWPGAAAARVAWMEQRLAAWQASADELGLSDDDLGTLSAALTESRARLNAALLARSASKNATAMFYAAAAPFEAQAGALIRKIRGNAAAAGDPELYALAQIDPPATPSPAPTPEIPTGLATAVNNDGSLELSWKARSPRGMGGMSYEVQRRLSTESTYRFMGNTGKKHFRDLTLPPGTAWASYRIIARRGEKASDCSEPVIVYLGVPTESAGEGAGEGEAGLGLAA
jgi:hypothetical protein